MILLKDIPKYESILEGAQRYPDLDPSALEAYLHFLRSATDLSESFSDYYQQHGISRGRFTVLTLLLRDPDKPSNPAVLADQAGVSRPTITGLLDGLEKDGLLIRSPNPVDRRAILVKLTKKGIEMMNRILPGYFERTNAAFKYLSENERKQLVNLTNKIQKGVKDVQAIAQKARLG